MVGQRSQAKQRAKKRPLSCLFGRDFCGPPKLAVVLAEATTQKRRSPFCSPSPLTREPGYNSHALIDGAKGKAIFWLFSCYSGNCAVARNLAEKGKTAATLGSLLALTPVDDHSGLNGQVPPLFGANQAQTKRGGAQTKRKRRARHAQKTSGGANQAQATRKARANRSANQAQTNFAPPFARNRWSPCATGSTYRTQRIQPVKCLLHRSTACPGEPVSWRRAKPAGRLITRSESADRPRTISTQSDPAECEPAPKKPP
jgi:hypothetical protein